MAKGLFPPLTFEGVEFADPVGEIEAKAVVG